MEIFFPRGHGDLRKSLYLGCMLAHVWGALAGFWLLPLVLMHSYSCLGNLHTLMVGAGMWTLAEASSRAESGWTQGLTPGPGTEIGGKGLPTLSLPRQALQFLIKPNFDLQSGNRSRHLTYCLIKTW